jgi:hypothetical protein
VMERRASQRYGLRLAISFCRLSKVKEENNLITGERLVAETSNISTGGIYFTTSQPLALNEVLDFSLTFPGLAHGANVLVTGRARVLRVRQNSQTPSESSGVAVLTEEYHILEPESAA